MRTFSVCLNSMSSNPNVPKENYQKCMYFKRIGDNIKGHGRVISTACEREPRHVGPQQKVIAYDRRKYRVW